MSINKQEKNNHKVEKWMYIVQIAFVAIFVLFMLCGVVTLFFKNEIVAGGFMMLGVGLLSFGMLIEVTTHIIKRIKELNALKKENKGLKKKIQLELNTYKSTLITGSLCIFLLIISIVFTNVFTQILLCLGLATFIIIPIIFSIKFLKEIKKEEENQK